VSEGQLRVLFNNDASHFDDNAVLLQAGANAAVELAGVTPETRPAQEAAALELAHLLATPLAADLARAGAHVALSPARQARRQNLAQWLASHRATDWTTLTAAFDTP
jgi:hypothetical protein